MSVELDGRIYTHADVGRLAFTGDTPEALDTALSGAVTDCLKRCFRQLGDQFGLSLYNKDTAKTAGTINNRKDLGLRDNGKGLERNQAAAPKVKTDQNRMTVEAAATVLCPVGSTQNPHWAGIPLGEVSKQANGERMLAYLSGDQFKPNGDRARQLAKVAAQLLLSHVKSSG